MDECLEYSCCPVSGEDLGADPQCDLQSPTSILTGLPEMSRAREKKTQYCLCCYFLSLFLDFFF